MKIFFVIASVVLGANLAWAAGACQEDREKLCAGIEPGEGRIARCMHDNLERVSPACKEQMTAMKAHMAEAREACQDDVQTLCDGIKPGRGAVMKCLKANKEKLSAACKEQFEKRGKHRRGK